MTLDEKLDEALKETFPASDAFCLTPEATLLRQTTTRPPEPSRASARRAPPPGFPEGL